MKKQTLLLMTLFCLLAIGCNKNNEEPSDTYDEGVEINGVVWATRNVGLPGTFADANNEPIVVYRWNSRVGWVWKNGEAKSTDGTTWLPPEFPTSNWSKENDPCPQGWRMPTETDAGVLCAKIEQLRDQLGDGTENAKALLKSLGLVTYDAGVAWYKSYRPNAAPTSVSFEYYPDPPAFVVLTGSLNDYDTKYNDENTYHAHADVRGWGSVLNRDPECLTFALAALMFRQPESVWEYAHTIRCVRD